jgi:hypothetical protein
MKQFRQQFAQLRADSINIKDAMEEWAKDLIAREDALTGRAQTVVDFAGRTAEFWFGASRRLSVNRASCSFSATCRENYR